MTTINSGAVVPAPRNKLQATLPVLHQQVKHLKA